MTHSIISETERFGSRYDNSCYEHIGECMNESCGCDITTEFVYYTDKDGNCFCSEECFKSYYGFEEI